jgi:hypothetical protein
MRVWVFGQVRRTRSKPLSVAEFSSAEMIYEIDIAHGERLHEIRRLDRGGVASAVRDKRTRQKITARGVAISYQDLKYRTRILIDCDDVLPVLSPAQLRRNLSTSPESAK